ncbi:MAG: hypothetical protein CSB48_14075 [Proteobacteria bacterium]|nr:MAG: hypothetical protein CSB48_14075 [Pseudomonadota bacterium]
MLKKLLSLLDNLSEHKDNTADSRDKHSRLAALGLMFQLGAIDLSLDESERSQIKNTAANLFQLDPDEVDSVVQEAESLAKDSTSLYEFTHYINENFGRNEKIRLIENLWDLALADSHLCKYEEHFIRRVADLIYVNHDEFIQTKLKSQSKQKA